MHPALITTTLLISGDRIGGGLNDRRMQMTGSAKKTDEPQLDLSDVDHRVGQLVGGGQLWDPCSSSDIRRWVMAMDYANPIHWDQAFARERSEEHTSELQSLMRISYAVFCLKQKKKTDDKTDQYNI